MSKKTFIHAENNHNILSSNEVRLYNPPKPEEMKIIIWNKELCNGAEWNDFLKCVEDKTKEIDQLKQQLAETEQKFLEFQEDSIRNEQIYVRELAEKDKEIKLRNDKLGKLKKQLTDCLNSLKRKTQSNRDLQSIRYKANRQLAIQELEKVKNLAVVLLEGFCHSIHYSQKEFRGHRYIEFYDLIRGIDNQIKELKGEKDVKD